MYHVMCRNQEGMAQEVDMAHAWRNDQKQTPCLQDAPQSPHTPITTLQSAAAQTIRQHWAQRAAVWAAATRQFTVI
jgi:hypothetical protein